MDQLTERVVILRLNQMKIVNKFFDRKANVPIPIWFFDGNAVRLTKNVKSGDVVAVTAELHVADNAVHVHALDFEQFVIAA